MSRLMYNIKRRLMKCKIKFIHYNWHQNKKIVILIEKMMIGRFRWKVYKKILIYKNNHPVHILKN